MKIQDSWYAKVLRYLVSSSTETEKKIVEIRLAKHNIIIGQFLFLQILIFPCESPFTVKSHNFTAKIDKVLTDTNAPYGIELDNDMANLYENFELSFLNRWLIVIFWKYKTCWGAWPIPGNRNWVIRCNILIPRIVFAQITAVRICP